MRKLHFELKTKTKKSFPFNLIFQQKKRYLLQQNFKGILHQQEQQLEALLDLGVSLHVKMNKKGP